MLGSKVKIKILRELCRFETKTFTSRELATHINVSHTAVLKSLGDLQGMNVITIDHHGRSNLITLNKESCLYSNLKTIFTSELETLNQLKEDLKKTFPKAEAIALFGSIASQTEQLNSDIDILIISKDQYHINEIIAKKQEAFSRKFGKPISAYVMTHKEFNTKKNTDFIKSILQNHLLIKGEKL